MEYRPSLPVHNDNVSHQKPVREFFLLFSGITAFLLAAFWVLGFFADIAVEHISPEMEAKIFSPLRLQESAGIADEDRQQAELQQMIDKLRICSKIDYPVRVHVVEAENANAVAFPGGRIVVFDPLLGKVKSENGLAFVLAHELAHFKNRDHLRGLGRGIVLTALVASLTGAGSDLTQMFAPAVSLGQAQYSQKREALADRQALEILNCCYGHVGGADEFFEVMKPREREGQNRLIGRYFASHPEAVKRIDNLHRLTTELGYKVEAVRPLPPDLAVQN